MTRTAPARPLRRRRARRRTLVVGLTTSALAAVTVHAAPAHADTVVCGHTLNDAIAFKFNQAGGEAGIGCPVADTRPTANGDGMWNDFAKGVSIYWRNTQAGATSHLVRGGIRVKWDQLGRELGFLGYPITDETPTPDGVGFFSHFDNGSIYWSPDTGAHEVHGWIRRHWSDLGWETGFLGYPTTDELTTPDGVGRLSGFQGGAIYWTPSVGPHEVHGAILDTWGRGGWETGPLGYPLSDERSGPLLGGRFNDFENGVLYSFFGVTDQLPPTVTLAPADLLAQMRPMLVADVDGMKGDPDTLIDHHWVLRVGTLSFVGAPEGYAFDGTRVHNRNVWVKVPVDVKINNARNASLTLQLRVEIGLDAAGTGITGTLTGYKIHASVPWLTSQGISASKLVSLAENGLRPQLGVANPVTTPDVAPLSVKVMTDNSLNVYVG